MSSHPPIHRRSVILAAPALLIAPTSTLAATPTPAQAEGPFYPRSVPKDRDADLVVFNGQDFGGEVIEILGQVFNLTGAPISGAVAEIWHCDPAGIYPHVGRNNGGLADPGFQGYGAVTTGEDGSYRFRTVRPGIYPGRVRHIHVKVRAGARSALTTQMYFPEEPGNAEDFLLRRAPDSAALIATRIDAAPIRYQFDLYLG
ncbi:MAG: protocatechuate 3,4-dioxygenase [Pseudomonadota bacterium]